MRKVSMNGFMILFLLFISFLMVGASSTIDSKLSNRRMENVIHVEDNGVPAVEWSKSYGGSGVDVARSVIQTSDGGYALAGSTHSFGQGGSDMWLVKTDASGNILWNQTYGSEADEWGYQVVQAADGSYAIVGTRWNQTRSAADLYMVKTNANGDLVWELDYIPSSSGGSADWGDIRYIVQASDGNFILCGSVRDHPLHPTYDWDAWVIKVSGSGQVLWDKPYFSSSDDGGGGIIQTNDGGYAFVGATLSWGGSGGKIWLVKIDASGTQQWIQTYGGVGGPTDNAFSVVQTPDGGYAIAGYTYSFGAEGCDFCLIRTDSSGNQTWVKTYGGASEEQANSMIETSDGGYLLVGHTNSFGAGGYDFWLVKTDSLGNMQWNQTCGGASDDLAYSVIQTSDGGYAIAGYTYSFGVGSSDFWLVKLASSGRPPKTWTVALDWSGDFLTIQAAIDAASNGDTIFVRNGTYSGPIVIDKSLILQGENKETTIIDGGSNEPSGSVVGVFSDDVEISNFTIQHCRSGGNAIWLDGYLNMTFSDNIITGCNEGVRILHSSGNIISNNNIQGCYYNTALGFNWAYNNTAFGNLIANNNVGIGGNFWNNTFFNNTIRDNMGGWAGWGISDNFENCTFFHNNIIDNGLQVYNTNSGSNVWDNGYPSGGNYWSDYTSVDSNNDGIGDTPYVVSTDNLDHYPLIREYSSAGQMLAPIADFTWSPFYPIVNEPVTFDASSSTSGYNGSQQTSINTYLWDFGDNETASGQIAAHTYALLGNYTVTLNVTDTQGSWNTTQKEIQVGQPQSPVAIFLVNPEIATVGLPVQLNASASMPGWNGTSETEIQIYFWDFGDGNTSLVNALLTNYTYSLPGIFNVTLTVTDSEGMNSSYTKAILVRMPTSVSISTSSTSSVVGFIVGINGSLYDFYGNSIKNETVVLYYTFPGIANWVPMASSITDELGHYSIQWLPTATGSFQIMAEWIGNTTHTASRNTVAFNSIPYMNQYVFTVESNSTISALAFNSTGLELSFTASGPSGTSGYVRITVAKGIVADIANIRVYLDNNQTEYSIASTDDSWLLTFNYTHSTHRVTVNLSINVISEFTTTLILPFLIFLTTLAIVVAKRRFIKLRAPLH